MNFKSGLINLILIITSVTISLIIVELIFHFYFRTDSDNYFQYQPDLNYNFKPSRQIFPGVKDSSFIHINNFGLRGGKNVSQSDCNILVVGGSTAECIYLDDSETWPYLLEEKLESLFPNMTFTVLNAGKSGLNSSHHILQLEYYLSKIKWIDLVIILQGINDLQYFLAHQSNYFIKDKKDLISEIFQIIPENKKVFYKNLFVYKVLKRFKNSFNKNTLGMDVYGENYSKWRENRQNAAHILTTLPNMTIPLNYFSNHIKKEVEIIRKYNKKVIFLTQPTIYKLGNNANIQKICWFGWKDGDQNSNSKSYYSLICMKKMIDLFNQETIDYCIGENLAYIDMANSVPQDTSTFFDDCHFNEEGAKKIANIIADYLMENLK